MSITVIIPMTPLLEFPSLAYRALGTYNLMAFNWAKQMREVAWPQLNALAAATYNNALAGQGFAESAQQSAIGASTAASQALAASNFKDLWATLAALPNPADRVLPKPACVAHVGRFWMLLNDLADIATSEPSDSNADWKSLDTGTAISQRLTVADAVVNAAIGVKYLIAAARVKLVLPTAGLFKGA